MTEQNTTGTELIEQEQQAATPASDNIILNPKTMNQLFKAAQFYSNSNIVPESYRGKPNDCFVALELAARMNLSPTTVMQSLYIVKGKPSWAGQMCKAMIDGCGRYRASEYVFIGERGDRSWGCYLQAINKATGTMVKGTAVTIQMAYDEGWATKPGSKWVTFPEQMLKYRAAAFFARSECPSVLMGYQLAEEVADVYGEDEAPVQTVKLSLGGGNSNE